MHWQTHKTEPITARHLRRPQFHHFLLLVLLCVLSTLFLVAHFESATNYLILHKHRPKDAADIIARCRQLAMPAASSPNFHNRLRSDRFEEGTRPILIQNARVWTGNKNGTEVVHADILLDKGLIKGIGHLRAFSIHTYGKELDIVDADGSWVTPGLVDLHSHLGLKSLPILGGASDGNSFHGIVQPWLRSLDGLNTHDVSYPLSIAGGVTTSLVLPGSANAIGGQAFVIKLRETKEKSSSSMLLEPPYHINTSFPNPNLPFRWRHIKHACGENPSAIYDGTRMDTIWEFRQAYNTARQIKNQQDEFCSRALAHNWHNLGEFPEVFKWEALVDVLRGRVKVNVHCYEAVDLDSIVRLSNEYKFPIAAFHHASEAYLVPDLLKKAYGKPPAVALFATFARYKREAYRSSEFAPRVLAQHDLPVIMKSDHPAIDSRHLIYEAQQAYFYGLPEGLAIASVTSSPSEAMGMGHRIGYIKEGYDADLVIWDSHPLALGATPRQVFVDGIQQLESPFVVQKAGAFQQTPKVPNFDKEAEQAVVYEGLPPLEPKKAPFGSVIIFRNVSTVYLPKKGRIERIQLSQGNLFDSVVTRDGSILCYDGVRKDCAGLLSAQDTTVIDLNGGSISPSLVSYGSPLGLETMKAEPSTNDGVIFDPLGQSVPEVLGGYSSMIQASDGLQFGSRNAFLAHRSGVTSAVSAPSYQGFYGGLSVAFSLGASHKLQKGAVFQRITALHISIRHFKSLSVSTQISALRRLLLGPHEGEAGIWFEKVTKGEIPLVVEAHNADIIATLIMLKQEVETKSQGEIRLTISGASEAHLLAKDLGEANIGVILSPPRPLPMIWEQRRILPGPPLSNATNLMELLRNNVLVGIGCKQTWEARNLPFDIAWAAIESGSKLSKEEALAIGSSNLRRLLGVDVNEHSTDLVVTRGGDLLSSDGKVVAILSPLLEATFLVEPY